jgi:hypothetical protein
MIRRLVVCGLTVAILVIAACLMISLVRPVDTGYRKVPIAADTWLNIGMSGGRVFFETSRSPDAITPEGQFLAEMLRPAPRQFAGFSWWKDRVDAPVWASVASLVILAVYPLLALLWGPFRRHRRRRRGLCVHCGYDLTGLTEPSCPECGAGMEAPRA